MKTQNIIVEKSFNFSLAVIILYKKLIEVHEYVLSKQVLRSATSIGANVEEAIAGQSRKDFIAKMSIASKEARETKYWIRLLEKSQFLNYNYSVLLTDIEQIINILTAIVKTSQGVIKKG
ncbi:MAG TPA: four helix bundle protein [Chryseolinea sp.]|jgi:four helix bundle protein|nr:four helix bundle protein [Chryseolinea sp.]